MADPEPKINPEIETIHGDVHPSTNNHEGGPRPTSHSNSTLDQGAAGLPGIRAANGVAIGTSTGTDEGEPCKKSKPDEDIFLLKKEDISKLPPAAMQKVVEEDGEEGALNVLKASYKHYVLDPAMVSNSPGPDEGQAKPKADPLPLKKEDMISKLPPAARQKVVDALEEGDVLKVLEASYKHYVLDPAMLSNKDIWVNGILPFLGPGHFLYLALVCKQLMHYYLNFFATVKELELPETLCDIVGEPCSIPPTGTLHGFPFSSVPCAEFWEEETEFTFDLAPSMVCQTIAQYGNLEVLKWARKRGYLWRGENGNYRWNDENDETCANAAAGGHLEILKWARTNGFPWDSWTCSRAARGGYLEVLKWARELECPWDNATCAAAASGGHLEILKWARENDCPWNYNTCSYAACGGHLEVLKWARENDCEWNEDTCAAAARLGNFEVLKWARENECPWNEKTCADAAWGGHLEILKWAREKECPWNEKTCAVAAERGHLECLKYAHEQGCDWDQDTCCEAAFYGHFECLKYAHEKGCELNLEKCLRFAEGGHEDRLYYDIERKGHRWNAQEGGKLADLVESRHQEMMDWLNGLNPGLNLEG